jgi:hypothetical protein
MGARALAHVFYVEGLVARLLYWSNSREKDSAQRCNLQYFLATIRSNAVELQLEGSSRN